MKKITYTFLLFAYTFPSFSQDVVEKSIEKSRTLSVYFSGSSSKIQNDNWASDSYLEVHNPVCFNGGLSYTKYFNVHFGLTVGIEYSTYKTNYRCAQYSKSTTMQTDPNGQSYYTITQADYTVNRSIGNIEIPICIRFESGALNKTRFFGDAGLKLCSAISGKKISSGSLTTMALYPSNYPNAGFLVWDQTATNDQTMQMSSSNEYNCKSGSLSFCMQAGIVIPITNKLQYFCSVAYVRSLGDINDSEKGSVYVNYLGESKAYKPSSSTSLGCRIGLLMNFGLK